MKKALVVGASGGMGYALVRELVSRNIDIIAFSRDKDKLESLFKDQSKVTIFSGDALNESELLEAAKGVDVIFHAISFPYQEWAQKHLKCLDIMIKVAESQHAKIAFVDNIYAYGRQQSKLKVTEEMRKNPHTKKGKIRLEMENKLKNCNVPALIVHMPDLYGPNAENTILHETIKNMVHNKKVNFVGNTKVAREFLYTYDGARAMVELAERSDTYNKNWNIPSTHPITGEELIMIICHATGYTKKVRSISKGMIRFLGVFSPFMKEMVEMMYLTEIPVLLSGEKYEKEIGSLPNTPYSQGIQETIFWMEERE
ncbi:SDR family NAD(P)-dependent oxidoreductase [Viridibacillus sp. YIM B01967]|uniref:SDR family NAD(P)-dependent oxidoreductase n=1 Tax=Viridibacillus soli TaxID=2798301 RepID=A0ABS1H722_9BACL|nr:SDR family NAD(P)-dependent oxidoreductase [Viridibacillus soli]MBK3495196.1 SDR family NAD(P)-dependent oxidoreductase [Viridibacillus soli]